MPYHLDELEPRERLEYLHTALSEANDVYKSSDIDPELWKDFYLGKNQWDGINPEGEIKVTIPLTSVMLDQHVFLLTNNPPDINVSPPSPSPIDRVKAQIGEDLLRQLMYDSRFPLIFQEATMTMAQMGDVYPYLFWDGEDKKRSNKGTAKLTYLSPSNTRIMHGDGFRFLPTAIIFWERLSPAEFVHRFGEDALGSVDFDSNYEWVDSLNLSIQTDKKMTVFTYVDREVYSVFTRETELDYYAHNLGFVPAEMVRQSILPDSVNGLPFLYNAGDLQQNLNVLLSAALELALDMSYPPLLEYNNALGSQKIRKLRRKKIKVRRSDKGESLQYLAPANNPSVLLQQIQSLIDLSYIVLQMPPASLGITTSNITSGFQARVYQQPATVKEMSWGLQWSTALQSLSSKFFKMIQKMNPESMKVELRGGEILDIGDIDRYDVSVNFAQTTPIDEVRNTQMMMLRLQNNLISVYQALEELGDENPFDTIEIMKEESQDPVLNPEKATRVAQAQAAVKQLMAQTAQSISQMGGNVEVGPDMQGRLPEEIQQMLNFQNPVNSARGLTGRLPEERREVPPQGGERLPEESLGTGTPPLPFT